MSIKDRKNFIKNFEKFEYMCGFFAFLWEYRSIRTQSPFLVRGIAELAGFRRAAYVPLSRIKPSRSSDSCRRRFYSPCVAVPIVLVGSVVCAGVELSAFMAVDSEALSLS